MAFSDTGENTQPRNGLKRNSLVLATHSALCKRPPFLPGAGGKERLSQEMRVVPGWGDKPPALVLIPQEEEGEHFLRAGSKKWDRCFKGKARGGGGGVRRAAAGLCAGRDTPPGSAAPPQAPAGPDVQPPPCDPQLLCHPACSPALGSPCLVPPHPCLAHAVISLLSPWSPGATGLSDAVWPLEPVCEVQISSAQTLCDRGRLLNFSVPWSPCCKTQPLPVVGEDEMCKPKRSPLNSDT